MLQLSALGGNIGGLGVFIYNIFDYVHHDSSSSILTSSDSDNTKEKSR